MKLLTYLPSCVDVFFNDTATTEIYALSLHDALPISPGGEPGLPQRARGARGPPTGHVRLHPRAPAGHRRPGPAGRRRRVDRKSTRLNSSHANISYAVFCLKKKSIPYGLTKSCAWHLP